MNVRAKFMLQEHAMIGHGGAHIYHTFVFRPQYDDSIPEDQRFATATPTGELRISVDNPAVIAAWTDRQGKQFYLDFTPVETPDAA